MTNALPLADVIFHNRSPGQRPCVATDSNFCPGWAIDHLHQWVTPTLQHLVLVVVPVVCGFTIAMGMALLAHRWRWLVVPFVSVSDALYTIPSVAFFVLLIPFTGLGRTSAIIALTCYTLVFLFRTADSGLSGVPDEVKDAGRGMGLTERQLLWRVELPLAVPTIVAGLRVATVSTVAIASLAVFIDGGGLGTKVYPQISFLTQDVTTGVILLLMAFAFDTALVISGRLATPWIKAAQR